MISGGAFSERYVVKAFASGGVVVDLKTGNYFQVDLSAAIACAALVDGDAAAAARTVAQRLQVTPEHAQRFVADTCAALDSAPVRGTPTGPYHFHPDASQLMPTTPAMSPTGTPARLARKPSAIEGKPIVRPNGK